MERLLPFYAGDGRLRSAAFATLLNAVCLAVLGFAGTCGVIVAQRVA